MGIVVPNIILHELLLDTYMCPARKAEVQEGSKCSVDIHLNRGLNQSYILKLTKSRLVINTSLHNRLCILPLFSRLGEGVTIIILTTASKGAV